TVSTFVLKTVSARITVTVSTFVTLTVSTRARAGDEARIVRSYGSRSNAARGNGRFVATGAGPSTVSVKRPARSSCDDVTTISHSPVRGAICSRAFWSP